MRADLVEDALQMAVAAGNPDRLLDLVHHSDRGSRGPIEPKQHTSDQFTVARAEHDILASMGSVGDAYDLLSVPSGHFTALATAVEQELDSMDTERQLFILDLVVPAATRAVPLGYG